MLTALGRRVTADPVAADPPGEPEAERFGRYEVLGPIGRAGVWSGRAAVDPQNGQQVSIWTLAVAGVPEAITALILRDAQALTRVRHTSLASTYDAGRVGDTLYVAQEPFTGMPLSAWLSAKRRSWREITRVFVSLGAAVGSLHAAGVLCRDPTLNKIYIDPDRRAVLIDIGLARRLPEAPPLETPTPEEAAGKPREPRSDQFAFSVLLHQALYGFSPYGKDWTRADTAQARTVPAPLAAFLDRGLSIAPEDRFPSIVQWVSSLHGLVAHRPEAPRVAVAALFLALLAASAGAVIGAWAKAGTPFASMTRMLTVECRNVERSFEGTWDRRRQDEIGRALWRSSGADAGPSWTSARREISAWVARWGKVYDQACLDAGARSGSKLTADSHMIECLAQSRKRLEALLEGAPELGARRTLVAAAQLGPPEVCPAGTAGVWLESVRRGLPADATPTSLEARAAIDWSDGVLPSAIAALEAVVAIHPEDTADEAFATALANLGRLRAEAGLLEPAQAVVTHAMKVRERVSGPDDISTAALWHDLGVLAARRGAAPEAMLAHRRALGIRERAVGPVSLEVASSLRAIGLLERDAQRLEEAVESLRRALMITEASVGEESGEAVVASIELGWALLDAQKAGEASERFTIAEKTAQRLVGRASPLVVRALEGRGVADLALGAPAKAVIALDEAVFMLESSGGGADQLARTKFHLAVALLAEGKDRPRAMRLAAAARDRLIDGSDPAMAEVVTAWLARAETP